MLRGLIQRPDEPLSRVELMGPEERQRWLVDRNATEAPPGHRNVVEWFEAQARADPWPDGAAPGRSSL